MLINNILEEILKLVTESISREEFVKSFEQVVKLVLKIQKDQSEAIKQIEKNHTTLTDKFQNDYHSGLSDLKNQMEKMMTEHGKMMEMMRKKIKSVDERMSKVKDGKDADEEKITEKVLSKIKIPEIKEIEKDLPKLGEKIRDGLELLQGKERLKIEAINGLKELLEELRNRPTRLGGGGFSLIAMQQHILSWTQTSVAPNGVLTNFVIGHQPNPTDSLEVMVDNSPLFETSDWTYAVATRTISFLVAPPNGSIIRYKCIM